MSRSAWICINTFKITNTCGSAGKESTCNVGDLGSIPELRRSLEKGKATHSSILAWRIPWTISPWGCKELDMTEQLSQLDSKLFENQASPAFGSFLSFETLSYIQQQSFPRYLGSHREIIHVLLHSDSYPSPQSSVCIWAFFILLRSFLAWATSLSFLLIFYFLYTPREGLGLAYVIDKVRL